MNDGAPLRQFGQGERPALAIHCSLAHSGAWRGVGQALADVITLTAFDLPGHGKNVAFSGSGDFQAHCVALALSLIDRPVDLIGHSFGATVALRLAVEHPEAVRTLTLIEPVFFAAAKLEDPKAYAAFEAQEAEYGEAMREGDMEHAARLFNRIWGAGIPWYDLPRVSRTYMEERMIYIPMQSTSIIDDCAGLLRPGTLEKADMPCALIAGAKTPEIIFSIHNHLQRRLPQAQSFTVPGAGHMAPITHPTEVATLIRSLIETA